MSNLNWIEIQDALYDWVSSVLNLQVIWANQDGDRPETPFATLNIESLDRIDGADPITYNQDSQRFVMSGLRSFVLSVHIFGDTDLVYGSLLDTYLDHPETTVLLSFNNISIIDSSTYTIIDKVFKNRYEKRSVMDITCYTTYDLVVGTDQDSIREVQLDGVMSGIKEDIDLSLNIQ